MQTHKLLNRALNTIEPSFQYLWMRRGDESRVKRGPAVEHFFDDTVAIKNNFYQQMATGNIDRLVDLFSWSRGFYPVDAVFTSRAGFAANLSLALSVANLPMPVVITEPRVYGPGEVGHNQQHPIQTAVRASGYAVCFGFYMSKHEKACAMEAASLICSPGVLMDFDKRAFCVDWPVEVADELLHFQKPMERKRLILASRLNSNKHWREIMESYAKVLMARPENDIEVSLHAGTGAFSKLESADNRWHSTSEKLPRDEFIQLFGNSHVGAYFSDDEGMNVTTQEMIMAGIAMVLPDRPWVRHLFEPLQYPFLVKRPDDLPGMLDWMLDNYEEAHARLTPIRNLIATERSWSAFMGKFRHLYDALQQWPRPQAFHAFAAMARDAAGDREIIPYSQLMSLTTNMRNRPGAQYMGSYSCYQAVREWDSMTNADPMLEVK